MDISTEAPKLQLDKNGGNTSDVTGDVRVFDGSSSTEKESSGSDGVKYEQTKELKTMKRHKLGEKKAKQMHQEAVRKSDVQLMADSAKRKSEVLEERNEIEAFSWNDEINLPETQIFKTLREIHPEKVLKRARLSSKYSRTTNTEDDN